MCGVDGTAECVEYVSGGCWWVVRVGDVGLLYISCVCFY